jgi:ADP-heptose:LPS heptosyltransferase
MRILVLVPGRRVEVLQASPLIETLAAGLPGVRITLACWPEAAEIARALDGVDEVVGLRCLDPGAGPLSWVAGWARVRRRRFEVAVICSATAPARLLSYLAGIPRRVGPSGGLTTTLLSDHVRPRSGENRAAGWLRCAEVLGIASPRHHPRLEPGAAAEQRALVQLHSSGIADGRLLVALAPGSAHLEIPPRLREAAAWPPERWAHLANQLAARHGAAVLFVGSAEDEAAVDAASMDLAAPHADLTGQLDLLATAALLRHCDLVVSGDSPLLHLAAAVGTPTVGLFGASDGRLRGAYGEEHRVVQAIAAPGAGPARAGSDGLMARIRVEDVLAAIESSL